jgi:pimeloyl-ACP methyl ester carboxylesterase
MTTIQVSQHSMLNAQYIDVDGIRTRYFEAGSGEPMVLFHGGNFGQQDNVDCAENWSLNWDGFARNFHVFAVDKIGQGFTDNPPGDDYTIEAVVRHAAGFLRAKGLDSVHLVGHSRGGYLVARLTREDQARVRTLTIVDSSTTAPGPNLFRGPLLANAPRPLLSRESIAWVTRQFSASDALITDDWLDVREQIAQTPKNAEAVARMATLDAERFLPSLERQKDETLSWIDSGGLRVPTLLVWGKNDPSAKLEGGLILFDKVAGSTQRAQMHIFNQAGHYSYREQPRDFVEVVTAFVRGSS